MFVLDVQLAITKGLNLGKHIDELYADFVKLNYHMLYVKHLNG